MGIKFVDLTPHQRDEVLRLVHTFAYLGDDEEDADEDGHVRGNS
jgi:hypothetical protein